MIALTPNVLREVNRVYSLSGKELGDKYYELFGERPSITKESYVRKEIIFRIQERFYGVPVASRKDAIARRVDTVKPEKGPAPFLPGTRLTRIYNEVKHVVTIRDPQTFEYEGCLYRSLSAIAKVITGTNWNGKRFFGVVK